eukprot:11167995-Lingulodinium_polyedra.AAC.1
MRATVALARVGRGGARGRLRDLAQEREPQSSPQVRPPGRGPGLWRPPVRRAAPPRTPWGAGRLCVRLCARIVA